MTAVFGGTPNVRQPFGSVPRSPAFVDDVALEQLLALGHRAGAQLLLVVEQVPGRLCPLVDERLLAGEKLVERLLRRREPAGVRRRRQIRLEVEQLELSRLAEDPDHAVRILDAREVDHDLIVALLADLRLGDAEAVDAVAEDLDGAVEVGLLQRPVRRRHRLEGHLEAALEVEAESRLVADRRAGNREQADADQRRDDQRDENEVRSAIHAVSRLAAFSLISREFFVRIFGFIRR